MKKKFKEKSSRKGIFIAVTVGIIIIGIAIFYFYAIEQAKIRGFSFGNKLEQIQTDLKDMQTKYESDVRIWKEGGMTKQQILEISDNHLQDLEELIPRYDGLEPPQAFAPSVALFKLSTEKQLESDKMLKRWIETGDDASLVRSDSLLQESFEYEMAALSSYKTAKGQNQP